jgi:cellulose synthase/poly-beta-1,6-N-acetylglucosamine synthase-like glycosyltransferase
MVFLFWFCLAVILYVYFGYPLLLLSDLLGERKPAHTGRILPSLSVIVPAHNEAAMIRAKLENLLAQGYPREKLEILVGNDGSTDQTAEIVRELEYRGVHLFSAESRQGKSAIQNELVSRSRGEILVFTDADCILPSNALLTLVESFVTYDVGLVTNCATIVNEGETGVVTGEGLYWKYERWLRSQESDRGLLAMASGSLFAMRRSLWSPLNPNVGDDFGLPLRVAKLGYRNVLESRVSAATQLTQKLPDSMLRMKVRIISKDLYGLLTNPECLNPLQVGSVAVGLWSHKLLRWAIPYFLIGLLISNLALAGPSLFGVVLSAQFVFYAAALAGFLTMKSHSRTPLTAFSSFCLVNFASLWGTLHCLTFRKAGQWKPVR